METGFEAYFATSGLITKTQLKERGWTDAGIKRFLRQADCTKENPHYRCAPPMKLFRVSRVEAAEATPEYLAWKEASEARKPAAKAAAQAGIATKKAKLLEIANNWRPSIPKLPAEALRKAAIENHNAYHTNRATWGRYYDWTTATPESDAGFLTRIIVNYIRHVLTDYEALLEKLRGRIGFDEAKALVRFQVYDAIAETYPDLASECDSQEERRLNESFRDKMARL